MSNINLPKEVLGKEAFKTFPAKEKEEYLSNLLKKILELNLEGVTISQIREATGLTYSSIWHHLEILSCTAQGNKVSRGNTDVYYPVGSISHLNEHDGGKAKYAVSTLKNGEGNFVCIHEKRENRSGNHTVTRGISIPIEIVGGLIKDFSKVKDKSEGATAEELLKEGLIKKEEQ